MEPIKENKRNEGQEEHEGRRRRRRRGVRRRIRRGRRRRRRRGVRRRSRRGRRRRRRRGVRRRSRRGRRRMEEEDKVVKSRIRTYLGRDFPRELSLIDQSSCLISIHPMKREGQVRKGEGMQNERCRKHKGRGTWCGGGGREGGGRRRSEEGGRWRRYTGIWTSMRTN